MTSASARPLAGPGRSPRKQFVARILDSLSVRPAVVARPALILMAGLPGSGKSTFARRLSGTTGAIVLESDALRQLLFGGPTHQPAESRALFAAIFEAAGRLLRDGHSVIIDATNLRRSDRRPAHELVTATGASLVIVRTVAPEPIIIERLMLREQMPDRDDHLLAGTAVYRHMAEEALPIIEEHRDIDTSDERATDAALAELTEELRLMGAINPAVAHVTGGSIS